MAGNFWQSSHYEQWLLDKTDILKERSEDLKIYTEEEYQKLMLFFCNLMQTIGTDPQVGKVRMQVIATASVYFRRFYVRRSLKDIDPFLLAPTCLFLASKVEEHGILSTNKLMGAVSAAMKKLPVQLDLSLRVGFIHEAEFILLEILDCCLVVYQPYRPLKQLMQELREINSKDVSELEAAAMKVCNDSLRTDACLLYAPHVIAIGCIQTALLLMNREKDFTQWFADMTVDYDKVYDVVQMLLALYRGWKQIEDREQLKSLLERLPKVTQAPSTMQQGSMPPPQQNSAGGHQMQAPGSFKY